MDAMECEKQSEVCPTKTQELLSEAKLHLRDIEEMLSRFTTSEPSSNRGISKERQVDTEENALVIERFRFGSVAAKDD